MTDENTMQEIKEHIEAVDKPTRTDHIAEIARFMTQEGISLEDINRFQTGQVVSTETPDISPSGLAGVSNDPSLSNETLTSRLVELERRFNNLNHAHYNGSF